LPKAQWIISENTTLYRVVVLVIPIAEDANEQKEEII
jgi:hypothetical protein